jgi:hypothetical protein
MLMSALYSTNTFNWIFIVLAHWKNNQRIDISLHYPDSEPTSLCPYTLKLQRSREAANMQVSKQ